MIPQHVEARARFVERINAVLSKACERWQARREGLAIGAFRRSGRVLKLATFLKEECDDAAYKFWKAAERGAKERQYIWIETERYFQHFLERLRRAGIKTNGNYDVRWFNKEDLAELEGCFNIYWEIEKECVLPRRAQRDSIRFAQSNAGADVVDCFYRGDKGGVEALHGWLWQHVVIPYRENRYQNCLWSMDGIVGLLEKQFSQLESGWRGYAWDQRAQIIFATLALRCIVRQDLGQRVSDDALRRIVSRWGYGLAGFHDCGSSRMDSTIFLSERLCGKTFCSDPIETITMLGLHYEYEKTLLEKTTQEYRPVSWYGTAALDALLFVTSEGTGRVQHDSESVVAGKSTTGVKGKIRDTLEKFLDKTGRVLSKKAVNEFCNKWGECISNPSDLITAEWQKLEKCGAFKDQWSNIKFGMLRAKSLMQPIGGGRADAATALVDVSARMENCRNYRAWMEFYSLCEHYMRMHGNSRMIDRALEARKKLAKAAGDEAAVERIDRTQSDLSDTMPALGGGNLSPAEQQLRKLLLREPLPLGSQS